jgi:predicted metal-dependent peptidase
MGTRDLGLVRGVVQDICRSMGSPLTFLAADAAVHESAQVMDGLALKLTGGGGTDMRVPIRHALTRLLPRPDAIVVITDCGTPWPSAPLPGGVKLIVCATGACDTADVPQWARLIIVDPETTSTSRGTV